MINFSFCDSNHKGDVPTYEFDKFNKFEVFLEHLLENKQNGKKVYVCFNSWRGNIDYSKGEQDQYTLMVTSQPQDEILVSEIRRLSDFGCPDLYLNDGLGDSFDEHKLLEDNETDNPFNFDYTIFEYNTYNEAFDFCKNLMEGITHLN
jgi:hypothetical protein